MRKLILVLVICMISFIVIGNSKATSDGILLRDFSNSSLLKKSLQLKSIDIMNEIIILPEEPFDEEAAVSIIENLRKLPHSLLTKIQENDIFIKLFVGNLTDNPTADHLKGSIPRGYTSDRKWDDVPGIGGGHVVLVKIGHSDKGMGHGSVNLELHELAHSIDRIVYKKLRFDPVFLNIWALEKYILFKDYPYFITLPEEYFAEAFAMFYKDEENQARLQKLAPETFEYIKNLK